MNGIHKIGSDGGGTVALTVPTTATNTTATLQAKDGTVALIDNVKGFKNYIINGNFDIWQYKDAGLTYPQTSSGYGSDDRWGNSHNGSTKTHSQVACTDMERALFNASYFSRTVVTSVAGVNNYVIKTQRIENIYKLAGKTITLSFWAKADGNKKLGVSSEVQYGTGGSPSSELIKAGIQQILDLTTVWKKFTIVATLPTAVGKTLGTDGVHTSFNQITFWFDAGSTLAPYIPGMIQQSGTFDIAQVQLEEGSVATPFEQRPYGLELSLCQRYYEINARNSVTDTGTPISLAFLNIGGAAATSNDYSFKVTKRIAPTLTFYNPFNGGTTSQVRQTWGTSDITVIGSQATTSSFNLSIGQAGTYTCLCHFSASAEL